MKKWFEFQHNFHTKNIKKTTSTDKVILFNIPAEKISHIHNMVISLLEKDRFTKVEWFDKKASTNRYKNTYYREIADIDEEMLESWLSDPEYDQLRGASGQGLYYDCTDQITRKKTIQQIRDYFPIDWDTADINFTVQQPGQVFPLHYDGFKSNVFADSPDQEDKVKRWLIMLEDQKLGQCFQMGDNFLTWKQGDVIAWKNVELPHGSANFGYWPRLTLRVTGKIVKKIV